MFLKGKAVIHVNNMTNHSLADLDLNSKKIGQMVNEI